MAPPSGAPAQTPFSAAASLIQRDVGAVGDADLPTYTVGATPLGGLFCNRSVTGLVLPAEFHVTSNDIELRYWSLLGLRAFEQRTPLSRVASVRLVMGIFWGSILVETIGGPEAEIEIRGLRKGEARDMVGLIEERVLTTRTDARMPENA